jgi:hypothetical protein
MGGVDVKVNMSKKDWVAASAAGRAAFCSKYLEHKVKGSAVSESAQKARARGEEEHERFSAQIKRQAQDRRCFVASHLFGISDPRTESLRQFRDVHLMPHWPGRVFVRIYYALSPVLVRACERNAKLDSVARKTVTWLLSHLQNQQDR